MSYSKDGWFRQQFNFLRRQFLQEGTLPFTDVLSKECISEALAAIEVPWNDRIFPPLVTLWVFLTQILSADHSCRAAVARLIASRVSQGKTPCSSETGAYCQARKRLPEKFFSIVARLVGRKMDSKADPKWLWKGRRVYIYDGSTVSMPDTPANQAAYPQLYNQKPGVGFPIARIAAIISLSCGAILDLGICRYAGKGNGELSLLRRMWDLLVSGDVLLTDRLMCSWREMVMLKLRGIDSVTRLNKRKADFRRGKRLGKGDHIVNWPKPPKPRSIDTKEYNLLPEFLAVREIFVRVEQPGFRSKVIIVVTTMIDATDTSKEDLAGLFRTRWNIEIDLRTIKITMQMDILRCKTPELVRKEIWTHILAYNLIRTIIAQAASKHDLLPRSISFKGTLQTIEAFQPLIAFKGQRDLSARASIYQNILDAIAVHRVAHRPDRFEPRARKRRYKNYPFLMKSRQAAKSDTLKGLT